MHERESQSEHGEGEGESGSERANAMVNAIASEKQSRSKYSILY